MRHKENKVMRCLWFTFSMVVVLTFLFMFGYEMWNDTAFGSQVEKHLPEASACYEEFIVEKDGEGLRVSKGGGKYDACKKTDSVNRIVLFT